MGDVFPEIRAKQAQVKEVLKPGETKTITVPVADMAPSTLATLTALLSGDWLNAREPAAAFT